jgi:hypothetical protein
MMKSISPQSDLPLAGSNMVKASSSPAQQVAQAARPETTKAVGQQSYADMIIAQQGA